MPARERSSSRYAYDRDSPPRGYREWGDADYGISVKIAVIVVKWSASIGVPGA